MAKVKAAETSSGSVSMPDDLRMFRLADWTRPEDVDGFASAESSDSVRAGTVEERRFSFLAAAARVRWSAARWRWRAEHEGVPLPAGVRRAGSR